MKNNEKEKFDILDFVYPFLTLYVTYLCFYGYFVENTPEGTLFDIILLCFISFIFLYGLLSIANDFKKHGIKYIFKNLKDSFKE